MNPRMQQTQQGGQTIISGPNGRRYVTEEKAPPPPTIFDQSQQPMLGSLPSRRPPMSSNPMEEQFPRLPSQKISPSPEIIAKLFAQAMFPGRR